MRASQDLLVNETFDEFWNSVTFDYDVVRKKKKSPGYYDVTSTLDIEVSAGEQDGYPYSFQFNVGGVNTVFRYIEDFFQVIDWLEKNYINPDNRFVFYVHNMGYEYYHMIQLMDRRYRIDTGLWTKPKKPLYIRFHNGLEIRDSFKLFQKSLKGATKGLPHAKLDGDLDYRIWRTPDTPLKQKEFDYCVNDVQGLWEAIEKLKNDHGYNQATIPLTNTAMVVQEVNRMIDGSQETFKAMRRLTLDKEQTILAYKCMGGGDTHGTRWRAGVTYENCNSHDEKSAHPSQQLLRKFPMGEPITMGEMEEYELKGLLDIGHGWIAKLIIVNPCIRPECPDPTISISKCEEIEELGEVDNGRLLDAEAILVYMDSNDYIRFCEGYTYEYLKAIECVSFYLDYLPEAFRMAIKEKFQIKEMMSKGMEYDFAKICVNTIFGACAQKQIRDEYEIQIKDFIEDSTEKWEDRIAKMSDEDVKKNQKTKFPFLWGLWTSSLSRLTLWELLKAVGWENVIYWDTDSAKYEGLPSEKIEEYNRKVMELCKGRNAAVPNKEGGTSYIGVAEREHPGVDYGYKRFRFLHAKCYAAEAWNPKTGKYEIETTIAGVGKEEGIRAMKGNIDNLEYGLYIADAGGNKIHYEDRPITKRKFSRETETASYIWMEPREYEIKEEKEEIEIMDNEIIGG